VNEEELLPAGRENPRWVVWENLSGNRFARRQASRPVIAVLFGPVYMNTMKPARL
jgi:hypothetical protein